MRGNIWGAGDAVIGTTEGVEGQMDSKTIAAVISVFEAAEEELHRRSYLRFSQARAQSTIPLRQSRCEGRIELLLITSRCTSSARASVRAVTSFDSGENEPDQRFQHIVRFSIDDCYL